jgi:hypothetical protein
MSTKLPDKVTVYIVVPAYVGIFYYIFFYFISIIGIFG